MSTETTQEPEDSVKKSMDDLEINPDYTRQLWFALFGIAHAIEQLGLQDQINQLVENNTGLGAYMFARTTLASSVIQDEE